MGMYCCPIDRTTTHIILVKDITPPAIATWLKHPVQRVHVLLDRKGKTLSHAYVEMANADAAKAALRSAQNSVLGRGKRARGVTVTKSSQEELMKAVSRHSSQWSPSLKIRSFSHLGKGTSRDAGPRCVAWTMSVSLPASNVGSCRRPS